YGVQLVFSDGHQRGIYPWAYLAQLDSSHLPILTET
ncbi:gamma-butyrobetaine hydroxylase-like domain-containing protein, partial [Pseudomonas sp. Sample_9]